MSNQPTSVWGLLKLRQGRKGLSLTDIITYAYLLVGVIVMFGPVLWLIMSSFKDASLIYAEDPTFLPYRQKAIEVEGYDEPLILWDVTFKEYRFNSAHVVTQDIEATNGYIQTIDALLVPELLEAEIDSLPPAETTFVSNSDLTPIEEGNLLVVAQSYPDISIWGQILEQVAIPELTGEDPFTVLAPTDSAITQFEVEYGQGTLGALLLPENADLLKQLVQYHILIDDYRLVTTHRLKDPHILTLLEGQTVETSLTITETKQLAQAGPPKGAGFPMIDPDNIEAGEFVVLKELRTQYGDVTNIWEAVPELHFSIENYEEGIEKFNFMVYFRNSLVVTVLATGVTLLINSMAAFGLSKYKFFGRDAIFIIIISTLMVPISVILVPAFLMISEVRWVNNLWGLIIPGAATPTGVFLLRQYMLTIPDELLDAARIDGASEWRIFWQVILPLARPALAVLAIFSVMWRWNDFLWPFVVVSRNDLFTLPVGLQSFQGALNTQQHLILAMSVLTLLPITVVFAFLQRHITSGIATTGMK